MASFPTSVFSPTSKSNGQVVDASHIDDLQAEVTAIEGGYINGTARLNSSNLNVLGTSTFAGNLTAASTSVSIGAIGTPFKEIYCSSLYINGTAVAPLSEAVRATVTSSVTVAGAVTLNFLNEDYIINSSVHSTAVNSSRFTPQSTGIFEVSAQLNFEIGTGSTQTQIILSLQDSSNTTIGQVTVAAPTGGAATYVVQARGTKRVDATGTWFKVAANQSAGVGVSVASGWAEMRKIG